MFGLGYVGCISMGCLAKNGHDVIGVDINQNKIDLVNLGKPTIIEDGIGEIFREVSIMKKITATINPVEAVVNSDISIICVGTPSTEEGHLNMDNIFKVAREIGAGLVLKDSFHIVVVRSTVLPGTNKAIGEILQDSSGKIRNRDFAVVSNPEFLREGTAVWDYYHPPYTVIGSDHAGALDQIGSLYNELPASIEKVGIEVAELIKYVSNTWHALKISFANEIGNICKKLHVEPFDVMDLFVKDEKLNISGNYLKPGFAYGGSCLPKDLKALGRIAHDHYLISPIIENIENSNRNQIKIAVQMIESAKYKRLGLIGLSFKSGTDDLRNSPLVEIAEYFLGKGYKIAIYDQNVNLSRITGTNKDFIESHIPHLSELITDDLNEVVNNSEVIVIAHRLQGVEKIIQENPDKYFIDLVGSLAKRFKNYEGICW